MSILNKSKTKIAVIISKFQLTEITRKLNDEIASIMKNHDLLYVIIQNSQIPFTTAYPLDVPNILNLCKGINETVTGWSAIEEGNTPETFDKRVRDYTKSIALPQLDYDITYYSLDSKLPIKADVIDISKLNPVTKILSKPFNSSGYRQGVIDGASLGYASDIAVIDCAAITEDGHILLGRKPHDTKYRFPGGFCDTKDGSAEVTVHRELLEETGINSVSSRVPESKINYVCSHLTNDYRKREDKDKIMTFLYHIKLQNDVKPKADDDLTFVKLVDFDSVGPEDMIPGHDHLMNKLKEHLRNVKSTTD